MDLLDDKEDRPVAYAGFWIRFVALIIDTVVLNTISFLLIIPLLGIIGFTTIGLDEITSLDEEEIIMAIIAFSTPFYLATMILYWLYYALSQSSSWQATLGKRAVGIIVTNQHGEQLSFTTASLRYLGRIISGMTMLIGYIIAGFTEKKQALHDMIASTYVVYKD